MKCRVCRQTAVIDVRRHNAAFCREHFLHHCEQQVARTLEHFRMFDGCGPVLVAVSGGKDSLALWEILTRLGIDADGLYVGLGIDGYSSASAACAHEHAARLDRRLIVVDLGEDHGFSVPRAAEVAHRSPCGACGLSKRHVFNAAAREHGYDVVATGHNLDDEAAVLLGNVLRWETGYLGRQYPVLPASAGFVRKVKPLVRLGERESAAYCVLRGIEYQVEECPMADGNRHLGYKELLNGLEARSPGSKAAFVANFWERGHAQFAGDAAAEQATLGACTRCGAPTPVEVCAFCRLQERASAPVVLSSASRA